MLTLYIVLVQTLENRVLPHSLCVQNTIFRVWHRYHLMARLPSHHIWRTLCLLGLDAFRWHRIFKASRCILVYPEIASWQNIVAHIGCLPFLHNTDKFLVGVCAPNLSTCAPTENKSMSSLARVHQMGLGNGYNKLSLTHTSYGYRNRGGMEGYRASVHDLARSIPDISRGICRIGLISHILPGSSYGHKSIVHSQYNHIHHIVI